MKAEEYEAHPAWTTLDALQKALEGDLQPDSDDDRYSVRRIHALVEFADGLKDADPVLVEQAGLNDLNTHLTQTLNHIKNYVADMDGNRAHLTAAAQQVVNVMNSARQHFPVALPDEASRAAKAASTRYKNSLDVEVERLVAQVDDLKAELADARSQRTTDQSAAGAALEDLKTKITESGQEVEALGVKLNAQIDAQRTSFEEEAEQRAAAFKSSEQAREAAEADRVEKVSEEAQEAQDQQESDAKAVLARLETYKEQAAALVDTTSRHAIAGDYGTWASRQASAALAWTVATVVIGLGTIAGLIYAVGSAVDDSIQFTVYKTSISIIGLIVAGYAARQASEHRREERTAKRLALDLAALEPFLEQIEDPGELRSEIARRVFVPEVTGSDSDAKLRTSKGSLSISELTQLVAAFKQSPPA